MRENKEVQHMTYRGSTENGGEMETLSKKKITFQWQDQKKKTSN